MTTSNISKKLICFMVIGLVLLLLTTFITCADDIVGPRLQDDSPEEPKKEEQDPNEGGGGGLARIFENQMSGHGLALRNQIIHHG